MHLSKKDDPIDFYTFMLDILTLLFKDLYTSDSVNQIDIESSKKLNYLVLNRQNIKQAIMTIPYNASLFAITTYIKETLKQCDYTEEENNAIQQNYKLQKIN
jgi:hypothetical protein